MNTPTKNFEERFDEEFGKNGGYLCQYDPEVEIHTSNPEAVKSFFRNELSTLKAELIRECEELDRRAGEDACDYSEHINKDDVIEIINKVMQ